MVWGALEKGSFCAMDADWSRDSSRSRSSHSHSQHKWTSWADDTEDEQSEQKDQSSWDWKQWEQRGQSSWDWWKNEKWQDGGYQEREWGTWQQHQPKNKNGSEKERRRFARIQALEGPAEKGSEQYDVQRLSAMGRSRYERLAKNWDAQMQKALEEEQKEKKQKEEAEEANRQQWLHWMEWQNYWGSQQMAYDARQWYYPPGMEHHNPSHAAQPSNPAPTVAQAKPKVHASPQDATPKGKGKGKKKPSSSSSSDSGSSSSSQPQPKQPARTNAKKLDVVPENGGEWHVVEGKHRKKKG